MSLFEPRQVFKLGPIRIERTQFLKSASFELLCGPLSISIGKWFFMVSVVSE